MMQFNNDLYNATLEVELVKCYPFGIFWVWPELRPADLCLPEYCGQLLLGLAKCYPGRAFKEKVASLRH